MNQPPTYNPLELLRRWVQGDTPLEEERQLEQLAEEDPFLAEALEGYRRHPEGMHAEQVAQLKARLRERGRKNRGLLFYLPRLAAAAVVLSLMVGGFWYINQDSDNLSALVMEEQPAEKSAGAELEKREEQPAQPVTSEPETRATPSTVQEEKPAIAEKQTPPPKPEVGPSLPQNEKKSRGRSAAPAQTEPQIARAEPLPSRPENRKQTPAADEIRQYSFDEKEIEILAEEDTAEAVKDLQAKISSQPAAPKMSFTPPPGPEKRKISGYVLGENGEPLIGANVLLEGTQLGAVTDFDGKFQLALPDSINPNLVFTYTGYQSQSISPGDSDSITIVLPEGDALLESVTVTGYSTARQNSAAPPPAARPENGFPTLRQYIRDNLKYPDDARKNNIKGKVTLRFRIQPDGSLFNFQVKKGLGHGCDEEAIRLLKEGPKWEGAGQEVTYSVRFKL